MSMLGLRIRMGGEWEPFNKDIMIGDFDKCPEDEEYLRMLDRQEILGEMYGFEDENGIFAEYDIGLVATAGGYDRDWETFDNTVG